MSLMKKKHSSKGESLSGDNMKTEEAFNIIKQAMIVDNPSESGSYAHSWHCNIAMACFDAMDSEPWVSLSEEAVKRRHRIANDAASRFMKICFNVETK